MAALHYVITAQIHCGRHEKVLIKNSGSFSDKIKLYELLNNNKQQ